MHEIRPQVGPQSAFHESCADIVFYGGGAGGGKTWSILAEPLRHIHVPKFIASIFRKSMPQLNKPGGLADKAFDFYPSFGGFGTKNPFKFRFFKHGLELSKITLEYLENEKALNNYASTEICYLGFDELTDFSKKEFWGLQARNRSLCGIRPYIRATMNPRYDSWIKEMILWFLDPNGEFSDPKKSGRLRWFFREGTDLIWADSLSEARIKFKDKFSLSKTFTFIPAKVTDNKILLEKDPSYLATLHSLQKVDRERLLHGNWKIKEEAGLMFRREWCQVIDALPVDLMEIRYWDFAGTKAKKNESKEGGPDYTAGLKMAIDGQGNLYIGDARHFRENPFGVEKRVINTATLDGLNCHIILEFDPGQAGKFQVQYFAARLHGYKIGWQKPEGNKIERFKPFSAQAEAGNVKILRGNWNSEYFEELENFPPENSGHDDLADATSGAYNALLRMTGKIKNNS
jgi:predicted phage terminase large subunit-like protein